MHANAFVDAPWTVISTTATAKFKEICLIDITIRKGRFRLLIFPMPKIGNF